MQFVPILVNLLHTDQDSANNYFAAQSITSLVKQIVESNRVYLDLEKTYVSTNLITLVLMLDIYSKWKNLVLVLLQP